MPWTETSPHDLRHGLSRLPKRTDLLDGLCDQKRFATEARPTFARLLDAIQLTLPADVIRRRVTETLIVMLSVPFA